MLKICAGIILAYLIVSALFGILFLWLAHHAPEMPRWMEDAEKNT